MKYQPGCYVCRTLGHDLGEFNHFVERGCKNRELRRIFKDFTGKEVSRISIWRHIRHLRISDIPKPEERLESEDEELTKALQIKAQYLPTIFRKSVGFGYEYPDFYTEDDVYRYNQIQLSRNMNLLMKKRYLLRFALDVEERVKKQRSSSWIGVNPRKYRLGKWGYSQSARDWR